MPSFDFEQVYRDNVQQVGRWACWLAGSPEDAEDVVQEVFLTAHRLLPAFRGDAKLATWLFRLTANASRHQRRRRARRRWLQIGAHVLAAQEPPAPSPEDQLQSSQDLALVRIALDSMPEKYRTLLILSRLEGLSGEQIAERTETKIATVWVRLHRARIELAARFEKLRRATPAPRVTTEDAKLGGPT